MNSTQKEFCFATLAIGQNYRALARELLSKDIEQYASGTPFLILTDRPSEFKHCPNVIAVKHQPRFFCDNDKTFLIRAALSQFEYCICIDADMRLLAPLPSGLTVLPGITTRSCSGLARHLQTMIRRTDPPRPGQLKDAHNIRKVAQKLGLDIENEQVKFVHEFLFIVKRDGGREVQVLELAETISRYLELHGTQVGVGSALGMAAAKVGFPVRHSELSEIIFFDDRIEKVRIANGQADPTITTIYFQQLRALKYPKRSTLSKGWQRIRQTAELGQRRLRIQWEALKDREFYLR